MFGVIQIFLYLVLICLGVELFRRRNSKLPPGPFQWPIVGNMFQLAAASSRPYLALQKFAQKYGDVMSIKLGVHKIVVLSSYEAMKDLLTKDEFSGRYIWPFSRDRSFHKELGIVFSNCKIWNETRKFTIKALRDFGFGKKSSMELVIHDEVSDLMAYLEKGLEVNDRILTVSHNFDLSVVNVLWSLVAGFRFAYDDPISNQMMRYNDKINEAFNFDNIYLPFPFLRYWFPKATGWEKHMGYYGEVQEFMKGLIDNIRSKMDKESEPSNFVEVYLQQIEQNESDPESNCTEENLIMILLDLFLAGSETTNSIIRFALLYMVNFPKVQEKVREEIRSLSPNGEMLSINDLHRMPYTKATMFECFRVSNMVPIPLAHKTLADYKYRDMVIPKDTCIMYNNICNFQDEAYWGDPQNFRPERFIEADDNGNGLKVVNTERVASFGFGKRICFGETLAWNSFFLYFTTMIQRYRLGVPDGGSMPPLDDPVVSFSLSPKPFDIKMTPIIN